MTDEIEALARLNASCAARGLEGQSIMAEKVDQDVPIIIGGTYALLWKDVAPDAFAAGREQGLREAAEVAQGVLYNVFEESLGDEVKAAIEALLSEKPA